MTAVPPRPAGFTTGLAACVCGHPLVNHWQTGKRLCMACPDGVCPDFTPRPAAPDATAGGGLRSAIAEALWCDDSGSLVPLSSRMPGTQRIYARVADAVLAAPALRDVLAAAARDAETTARLRAELANAARLLNELTEDTDAIPCRYDHHGQCQEHSGGERCYDRDAHEFLKSIGIRQALDPS